MSDRVDVVVVGSGAGGGVVAGELAARGRSVVLLEAGPHLTAADFTRWEAKATHDLWWPIRFAPIAGGGGAVALIGGRCVGGGTTINTKVALRAHERDLAKWREATSAEVDLDPHYDRVEAVLGVRERTDWPRSVRTVEPGFHALGATLEPVRSYTDANCSRCGACLQGCPTNAGKSTMNTYIAETWARGQLDLRPGSWAERILVDESGACGVEYRDAAGEPQRVDARVVVAAAGTLNTPQLLLRSGVDNANVGRHLGFHPARLVYGLFDEPQDAHMVYPITAHSMEHQHDDDGGFVIEATTIMDPIGFATTTEDDEGPLWGEPLVRTLRAFRRWVGLLVMCNDDNNGVVSVGADGQEAFAANFEPRERERFDAAYRFTRDVLLAAGASEVVRTGFVTTHVQGTCRLGTDPAVSVVDTDCESWDVPRLFVGDGSLVPRTLSVNPSLTFMALASRLAEHIDADAKGYLQ